MPNGFLKVAFVVQVVALVALVAIGGFLIWAGMWLAGLAYPFMGAMMVKPWSLRWPRDQHA